MPSDPIHFTTEILAGTPSPEALAWLQQGFLRHLAGEPLTSALGFTRYTRGLSDVIKHRRVADSIQRAARLLGPDLTTHSRARIISSELKRLQRVRRRRQPSTWFELHLMQAIEAAGPSGPPTSTTRLWEIIAETPIQGDEI